MNKGEIDWAKDHRWLDPGDTVINLPCRRCLGCNTATARDWSIRAVHEALLHTENWTDPDDQVQTELPNSCVITLTYDEDHLPEDGLLRHNDFQRFMKRLRIRRQRQDPDHKPIRFFMCGEYGGKTARCHFHSILFGESFSDRYEEIDRNGKITQMSHELDELWSQPPNYSDVPSNIGRATVDSFTFAGAAYVAGYVAKKTSLGGFTGPLREDVDAGGVVTVRSLAPEYRKMSSRLKKHQPGGLGGMWLIRPENMARIYDNDECKILQWTFHPPRYYDTLLKKHRPDHYAIVIGKRLEGMAEHAAEWTPERCAAAELIALSQLAARSDSL